MNQYNDFKVKLTLSLNFFVDFTHASLNTAISRMGIKGKTLPISKSLKIIKKCGWCFGRPSHQNRWRTHFSKKDYWRYTWTDRHRWECVKTAENYKNSAYIYSKFSNNKKQNFPVYPF